MKMLASVTALTAILLLLSCAGTYRSDGKKISDVSVVPKPVRLEKTNTEFLLDRNTLVQIATPDLKRVADYLSQTLRNQRRLVLDPVTEVRPGTGGKIELSLSSSVPNSEGYELAVEAGRIQITGKEPAGGFYGVQTLLQLIPTQKQEMEKTARISGWTIPGVRISDTPRFVWRGMHLDVCRHFFPKAFVKRYIDLMAVHKMNVFHWHLTEDQGWRIEIKKYPRLTEIGAWRVDREDQDWGQRTPQRDGEKATYGGYYTQDDVREIVEYARERFITVVPEIEMPAHAIAALAAYPELSCTGGPFFVMPGGVWPIVDIYCAGIEKTFELLEGVLGEVIDLFPSKYIHVGGDEAAKANWKKCPKCQARIKAEGLKDETELQSYFIKRIEKFLISKNRRLIGWDEILEGGLAPEATVMSWRGMEGGISAAKAGHDVVMSPTDYCYFDYYQTRNGEPKAIGDYLPIEKVYAFEPVPDNLEQDKSPFILGTQGNVWTEYMPTSERVEYMALPRMCALAEVAWTQKNLRNLNDFLTRMAAHYNRLDLMDVHYCRPLKR